MRAYQLALSGRDFCVNEHDGWGSDFEPDDSDLVAAGLGWQPDPMQEYLRAHESAVDAAVAARAALIAVIASSSLVAEAITASSAAASDASIVPAVTAALIAVIAASGLLEAANAAGSAAA